MRRKGEILSEYCECECRDPAHTVHVTYADYSHTGPEIVVSVQLCPYLRLFKRVWAAVRYVLRWPMPYEHWDVCMLGAEDAKRMQGLLTKFINEREKWERR